MTKASVYNYQSNDVNGKFGTDQTATGIPISDKQYTAAVPMNGSPYRPGDVVIIKNNTNNTSAIYLINDLGNLPHADIDIVEGVGTQALGMEVTKNAAGKPIGLSNSDNISIQKVGKLDFKNGAAVKDFQLKSHEINQGKANLSSLASIKGFNAGIDASKLDKTLASYAPEMKGDELPDRLYDNMKEGESRRKQEDYLAYLNNKVDPADKMFMLVVAAIIGFITGEPADKILNMFAQSMGAQGQQFGTGRFQDDYERIARGDGSWKYNETEAKTIGQAPSQFGAIPKYTKGESAGEYYANAAKSLIGQGEVGDNGGAFCGWLRAPVGRQDTKDPYCGYFVSRLYAGTGLFNYTGSSLDVAEQGASTGSYKAGIHNLDGIEKGDPWIKDRGTTNDGKGHIGIVTDVEKVNGKVVAIKVTEANKTDHVVETRYTVNDLRNNRYLGYVDVSDRAQKLGINLEQKLEKEYGITASVAPEQKAPVPTAPAPQEKTKEEAAPAKPAENKSASTQPETAEGKPDYAALVEEAKARVAAGKGEVPAQGLADLRTKSAEQSASIA